jgi:hypothetical protein
MGASDDVEDCVGCIKLGLLLAVVVNKRSELVGLLDNCGVCSFSISDYDTDGSELVWLVL